MGYMTLLRLAVLMCGPSGLDDVGGWRLEAKGNINEGLVAGWWQQGK